jgi:hypothetical protein
LSNTTDVNTEPALTAAARLTADVADLDAFVNTRISAIEGLHGCWGTGGDGQAFGERYEPWAADTIAAMQALLLRLADTGINSGIAIQGAEAADEANAADLSSVGEET